MMRLLIVVFCLLVGCEPKYPMCDYCKEPRQFAKLYQCRKCGKAHSSCDREKPLHTIEYAKGSKEAGAGLGYGIRTCPE